MGGVTPKLGAMAFLAVATILISPGIARAAGQFDGNWVLDASGAGGRGGAESGGAQTCPAFRVPLQIKDNQIAGNYTRSASNELVASPRGTPLKGSVQPDGSFTLQWEAYSATGKITSNTMTATWRGQCGTRSATGTRVQ